MAFFSSGLQINQIEFTHQKKSLEPLNECVFSFWGELIAWKELCGAKASSSGNNDIDKISKT